MSHYSNSAIGEKNPYGVAKRPRRLDYDSEAAAPWGIEEGKVRLESCMESFDTGEWFLDS